MHMLNTTTMKCHIITVESQRDVLHLLINQLEDAHDEQQLASLMIPYASQLAQPLDLSHACVTKDLD
jgi:hypothetical protein